MAGTICRALVPALALSALGCSSTSHSKNLVGGAGGGGTGGTSGSTSGGGEPNTGGTNAAGTSAGKGGEPSTGGTNAAGTGGAGGTSAGTGGAGGTSAGTGGGVALPEYDYVLTNQVTVPPLGNATVRALNPETGEEEFTRSVTNPNDFDWAPKGFAALPDGTFRVQWSDKIIQLDSDLNQLGVVDVTGANAVDYAVLPDGSRALLRSAGTLVPLTAADAIDATAAIHTIGSSPTAVAYFALADSARLLWASGSGAGVVVLTANSEATGLTHAADTSNAAGQYFDAADYHVAADGTVRVAWTASSAGGTPTWSSRLCTYASETDLGTMPEVEGWGPGTCWLAPLSAYPTYIHYTTFRR